METKKEKKVINPIVGWLLFAILGFLCYLYGGSFFGAFVGAFTGDMDTGIYVASIVICILYAIIYDLANRKTFDGVFKAHNLKLGFLTFTPWVLLMIVSSIIVFGFEGAQAHITSKIILLSLYAGICEETIFRAIPVAHMMRCYDEENKVLLVCILTSILFAIVHGANLLQGADLGFTLLQLANAFALGMMLCTSYLVSGSIIPSMIIHTINDVLAFMSSDAYSSNGIFEAGNQLKASDYIMVAIGAVLYIAISLWMLRKAKRKDVLDIWAKKWNKNIQETC